MTSTPSSTNDVNASICDFWSRLVAGAYLRSKPFSALNVSCMLASLAARHAPSGPTATNPTVTASPSAGASAVVPDDASVPAGSAASVAAGADVPSEPLSSSEPQAAKTIDAATTAASAAVRCRRLRVIIGVTPSVVPSQGACIPTGEVTNQCDR